MVERSTEAMVEGRGSCSVAFGNMMEQGVGTVGCSGGRRIGRSSSSSCSSSGRGLIGMVKVVSCCKNCGRIK